MPKTVIMTFWRDNYTGPACLEYSWVPEGKRRNIQLEPGQQKGTNKDEVDDGLDPSHVQVYVATNNEAVSIANWQFPEGKPGPAPIMTARVEVHQEQLEIIGAVIYEDGSNAKSKATLDKCGRDCPTE